MRFSPLPVRIALGCAAWLLTAACLPLWAEEKPEGKQDALAAKIHELTHAPHYRHAHWGMLFFDLNSGEVIYQENADKLFAPASTTKCFTVATALDALGADYRFRTPVYRRGEVTDAGELKGDLILVASGDLTMGGRTTEKGEIAFTNSDHTYATFSEDASLTSPDPLAGLNEIARQIAAAGIKKVSGDLLVDDRLFEHAEGSGSGPGNITPIIVNDNVLDFLIEPTEAGQPAKVTVRPQTKLYDIKLDMQTVEKGGKVETGIRVDGNKLTFSGKIPAGRAPLVRIYEVPDPAGWARSLLIEALQRAGVEVSAPIAIRHPEVKLPPKEEIEKLTRVAELESPPFSENARLILKVSHNLHASTLPLLVAAHHGKRTLADGLRLEHAFLKKAGVEADAISFGGGAGGARGDYVTPKATVELLVAMTARKDFALYERAMPSLGVDGTLAKSISQESPARGNVHAKTGTLLWDDLLQGNSLLTSKALAGYMTTAKGRKLAFAAFVNGVHLRDGVDTKKIGGDLGKLAEIVYLDGKTAETADVQGSVVYNGKPVAKGKVLFHPKQGKAAELEIKDGKFKGKIAAIGRMDVTLEFEGVPEKYQSQEASGLVFEIQAGENLFSLVLRD